MQRIVIVGAGLAGLRAGQALRNRGFDGTLTLVGQEPHPPYNRPPLSKHVLAGDMDHHHCSFPTGQLAATWILGSRAVALDRTGRTVALHDGRELPYDGLVITTGRRARHPPELPPLAGMHTLRTLDDCLALREATGPDTRVAIVGAGFLGCEVAATLRRRGVADVILMDAAPHPMPALGPEVGTRIGRVHAEHGVRLYLGTSVEAFEGTHRVQAVRLSGGTRIAADLVILAVGSTPNSEWLAGSGLALHQGDVLCDQHCIAVGTQRIVAAGDIAAWPHPHTGEPVHIEHWTNAGDMAKTAAANLLAPPEDRVPYAPVPTFWTDQYDVKIKAAGLMTRAINYSVVEEDPRTRRLVLEGHRDGELVAAVTFNKPRSCINYQRKLTENAPSAPTPEGPKAVSTDTRRPAHASRSRLHPL